MNRHLNNVKVPLHELVTTTVFPHSHLSYHLLIFGKTSPSSTSLPQEMCLSSYDSPFGIRSGGYILPKLQEEERDRRRVLPANWSTHSLTSRNTYRHVCSARYPTPVLLVLCPNAQYTHEVELLRPLGFCRKLKGLLNSTDRKNSTCPRGLSTECHQMFPPCRST